MGSLKDNPVLLMLKQRQSAAAGDGAGEKSAGAPGEARPRGDGARPRGEPAAPAAAAAGAGTVEQGTVRANERGFGFLETDSRESFFISPREMTRLMHGDRISGTVVTRDGRSRVTGISLVQPFLSRFVARVAYVGGRLTVVPDHPDIGLNINADNRVPGGRRLREGDWVIAVLTEHAMTGGRGHRAEIREFVAAAGDEQTPWWVVLRGLDLPRSAPEDLPGYVWTGSGAARADLGDLPFVTIDSAKTRDMDDALFVEKRPGGGWNLWVAIADPTGYIGEDDALDAYAADRAFSIYLPGMDIPMLTRTLSDDLCSLRENEPRHVLAGRIAVNPDGSPASDVEFMTADIRSRGKLAYDDVSDLLEGKETSFAPDPAIRGQLETLRDFSLARWEYRKNTSSVFREKPEYEFVLNERGGLKEIRIAVRRPGNAIVEEAMILANGRAGKFLAEKCGAGIFNVHAGIEPDRLAEAREALRSAGYPEDGLETVGELEGYCRLRRWLYDNGTPYLDARILRCTAYAEMSAVPGPHFGLGLERYATWTSPIRKYGDMVNHRIIKSFLAGGPRPRVPGEDVIARMNRAKKRNRSAERMVRDWLYADYLRPEIAKKTVFEGEVSDVSRGGVKVTLAANGARVFVPCAMICPGRGRLTANVAKGEMYLDQNAAALRLGMTVRVRIAEVDATRAVIGELDGKL